MGFNCFKATVTSRRQFTFYHSAPRNSWCSFYQPHKDEESTLEPPSGFEHGTPGCLNHLAIIKILDNLMKWNFTEWLQSLFVISNDIQVGFGWGSCLAFFCRSRAIFAPKSAIFNNKAIFLRNCSIMTWWVTDTNWIS